ncbi:asparagine synthetase [glutamine-hydrolyzing] [Schistocerca americana]|uniref:asparagine synthetase [glutamine-hydrolyzing] n=1 Tax=Schistocerca americana TaxID=7009 RepID=UPI001F4F3110|nr:asparagine synthetase [glutamine-hydrolyzing] [Schistocerca americana]XP_046999490.1 asparagine synthetase [glutamine-hydrolyzing] [Schistocerca americana]
MCGIWAVFGLATSTSVHSNTSFSKISHRGPDAWRIEHDKRIQNSCIGFHRLAIVDCIYGMQPMKIHAYPHLTLICNGEIYNCKNLAQQFGFKYETNCDVESAIHLFAKGGISMCARHLDGVFALCIIDSNKRRLYLARDPFGVRPLFRLRSGSGVLAVSSEAKGLMDMACDLEGTAWKLEPFPPGVVEAYQIRDDGTTTLLQSEKYYNIGSKPAAKPFVPYDDFHPTDIHANIRTLLRSAVRKRLMSDRRIGCLLSGGLDSSLVTALLVRLAKEEGISYPIQTFSIGMDNSPDIIHARKVAEYLGTEHHQVLFTPEDVRQVLDDVIHTLETFDITTIRASVGMYLIARYIKAHTDSTVIFSGEGADELCEGYIYFRDAPDAQAGAEESLRLLKDIYLYDGLRVDRTLAAFCLEARVPFLDQQFTHYFMGLPPAMRCPQKGIEKHLLRSAFDETDLLPKEILWRHKEAFSDGVTSKKKSLFNVIQDIVESQVTDNEMAGASKKYPHCTPPTKEAYYYRKQFEMQFPNQSHLIPYFWMPRWVTVNDPSARFISHYSADSDSAQG